MFSVGDRVRKISGACNLNEEGTVVNAPKSMDPRAQLSVVFDTGGRATSFSQKKFELIDKPEDWNFDV